METKTAIILAFLLTAFGSGNAQTSVTIRVGAFPNITHPQAMVGKANGYVRKSPGSGQRSNGKHSTQGQLRSKLCLRARST